MAMVCVGCVFGVMAQRQVETATEEPEGYEYVPIVREGIEWGYGWSVSPIYGKTSAYYLQFEGDTVIGNKTYKKCYRYNSWHLNKANSKFAGFVREEKGKVYSITKLQADGSPINFMGEQLIYDFTAMPGSDVMINGDYYGTVSRIGYINLRGRWRKAIYLRMYDSPEFLYAVDGLGIVYPSEGYLLNPFPDRLACTVCFTNHLNYVSDYPQCDGSEYNAVYDYRYDEDYEQIMGSVEDTKAETAGLSVMQGDGWLRVGGDCDCYRRAELTDAKGAIVDAVELSGGSEAELSTAGLSPGVYVVSLISDTTVRSVKVLVK